MPRTVHPIRVRRSRQTQTRGPKPIEFSKSGGAVKGQIPWPGGTNAGAIRGSSLTTFGNKPVVKTPIKKVKHI